MRPERVVLPAPAISQELSFWSRGEQLGVEELIPEPSVERLGKAVLPWGSRRDVGRAGGGAGFTPVPQGLGDELRPVVRPDECRCRVEAGELLQHRHHVLGLAAPAHPDRQAEAAVLVDHVQELEPAAVGGGIELEIHGPHLMGMLSTVTPHQAVRRPCPLALPGSGPLQAFLPPEPLHPLVVHAPALPSEQPISHPPAPANVLSSDLTEPMPQLPLLDRDDLGRTTLGAPVLAYDPADPPLRCPVTRLQNRDGPPATLRAQKFPSARSLSMAFSSSASARSFLSRAFSFSS